MTDCDSPIEGLRAVALVVLVVGASLPISMTGTAAAAAGNSTDGFVYVDGNDGNLNSLRANGSIVDYGVGDAKVIGPRADVDGDGDRDVPFVDSNGKLKIVDDDGTTQQLGDLSRVSPRTTNSKLAIGDWDGDGNYDVFFASQESQRNIYRVDWDERDQEPENLNLFDADAAQFMLGSTDITGDGIRDLVFVTSSSSLYYVNGSREDIKLTGSTKWGANNNIGLGEPEDLNNSGGSNPAPGDYNFLTVGSGSAVQVM
jgi:hypothetical protein